MIGSFALTEPDSGSDAGSLRTAAVPDGDGWRMLRGDEVGALLAAHLVDRGVTGTFAESIVSSSLLGRIAEKAGLPYEETLTGFKWIARVDGLRRPGQVAAAQRPDGDDRHGEDQQDPSREPALRARRQQHETRLHPFRIAVHVSPAHRRRLNVRERRAARSTRRTRRSS